jgi:hypothetical protein
MGWKKFRKHMFADGAKSGLVNYLYHQWKNHPNGAPPPASGHTGDDVWSGYFGPQSGEIAKSALLESLGKEKVNEASLKALLGMAGDLGNRSEVELNPELKRIQAGLSAAKYFADPELLRRATDAQDAQTQASRKGIETSGKEAREQIVQALSARGLLGGSGEQQQKGKAQAVESQALLNLAMQAAAEKDTPKRELATAESQALANIIAAENDMAAAVRAGEATGQIGGLLGALQGRWQDTSNAIQERTQGSLGELLGNIAQTGAGVYGAGARLQQSRNDDAFDDWFSGPRETTTVVNGQTVRKPIPRPKKQGFFESLWG